VSTQLPTHPRAQEAPSGTGHEAVAVLDPRPTGRALLRETWQQRRLILPIGIRVIVKGTAGAKLGRGWLVIRPVMSIFAMSLLFGAVLDTNSGGAPYIIFLLVGMLAWMSFERVVFWATRSFDVYRRLAKNLNFPLLLVPTSSIVPAGINFIVIAVLTALTAGYFWWTDGTPYLQIGPKTLVAVAGMALAVMLAWGCGLWLSALNAKARDVRLTLRYILMVWMYVTPVVYPVGALPSGLRFLATINPVAAPVEMVKHGLLGYATVRPGALAVCLVATVASCVSGLWFFARLAPGLLTAQAGMTDEEEDMI
jgi:lipopolysaccharide transport system permease protein